MPSLSLDVQPLDAPLAGDLVLLLGDDLAVPPAAGARWPGLGDLVARAAAAERFKAKARSVLVVPLPGLDGVERLVLAGLGSDKDRAATDWRLVGGALAGKLPGRTATLVAETAAGPIAPEAIADLALGARLRTYAFDRYKTKKKDDEPETGARWTLLAADPDAVAAADARHAGLAEGVHLARDLVNEPGNVLFPAEFARRATELSALGVEVEVFEEATLKEMGFRALVAVGQGSGHGSRVAVMRWNGGGDAQPVAILGKGVCFDSGGISIKPAGGMEDMKGDMAGAATVVGLMHALASRGAKANVVGAIGLTENMPDGDAQRPGDIISSLSGQTVEMINSDAEGRLVLGDLLWYVQDRFKPRLMIDLATLTGAIIVALGQEHAGLFANDDELADRLLASGRATGEAVWRMPLGPAYDKMIDSKFADMKNTGGRHGGSITAAQFLQRFVNDVPWAHLDIAGTAMNAPQTDINPSWGSGWGVRLLDRFIRDHHEA